MTTADRDARHALLAGEWDDAAGGETLTHAVIYDASDSHHIEHDAERVTGCSCGFVCEEWDDEGDTLVSHLRALGPAMIMHIPLDSRGGPPE
jgi:hypothetical protein